ncbi:hypothetical protein QXB71_003595 [Vibrio cholerae]|nr:hypothetical protein [Vibrio cholerae]
MITVIVKQNESGNLTVLSTNEAVRVILVEEDICGEANMLMNNTPCIGYEQVSTVDNQAVKKIIDSL